MGASAVKVLVTSLDGVAWGRAVAGCPVSIPAPGQVEANPKDWWTATRRAVHAALDDAGEPRPSVTGLAVAGQMHAVVLADECGAALRPAILGLDQRATAEAALYREMPGDYTAPLRNGPAPGMAGPVLCWLATHEPHTLRHAWWALQPKDWLRLRLTGRAATDPTDASGTLLFDLARGTWADPLVDKLGLPRDKLPPVSRPAETAGHLRAGPAAELGLPRGIPVAVGAGDTAAGLYAAGVRPDEAMLTLGRGGQWVIPVPFLPDESRSAAPADPLASVSPAHATGLYRAVGDGYYRLAPVRSIGTTLDWVRQLLGASWQELYDTASRPGQPDTPRFDPGLPAEPWNPGTTGNWAGLRFAHQREDLMRSALQGLADLLRQRLDDLRAGPVTIRTASSSAAAAPAIPPGALSLRKPSACRSSLPPAARSPPRPAPRLPQPRAPGPPRLPGPGSPRPGPPG